MTTREYLQQIERYDYIIENKIREIERLGALIKTIPALPYDKDKVQASNDYDRISETVAKLIDDKHQVEELLEESRDKRNKIIMQIEAMPNPKHVNILSKRYLQYHELYRLVNIVGYSYSQVKNIHREAIGAFEKLYRHEYKNLKSSSKINPD